jgi:hypothetical protein
VYGKTTTLTCANEGTDGSIPELSCELVDSVRGPRPETDSTAKLLSNENIKQTCIVSKFNTSRNSAFMLQNKWNSK